MRFYRLGCQKTFHLNESFCCIYCKARQCSPLRRKFMECSINNPALSLLMKHLVIGQRQQTPNFSAFHWSPHGSLVSTGQYFVTTTVVHIPKRTETSSITESDQSGPNHQLLQLCTARTAWSDSDQAVRAVHSCISWLSPAFKPLYANSEGPLKLDWAPAQQYDQGLLPYISFLVQSMFFILKLHKHV